MSEFIEYQKCGEKVEILEKNPHRESLIAALEQNWLHARHVENERLWFTNIFVIVVAGVLAFIGEFKALINNPLVLFLLILSGLGLILTIKISDEFDNHIKGVRTIIKLLRLEGNMAIPLVYEEHTTPRKIIRVRNAFLGFYVLMFSIWTFLSVIFLLSILT